MSDSASCQVGVTGHRQLPGADPALLRLRLEDALTWATRGESSPCLATSLAEGGDRLVAEIALELGYTLYCALPFPAADYEHDFAEAESVDTFRRLLARAVHVTTAQLPIGATREAGYTAAGRAMLAASRMLLALWDGQPPRGEGGTGQIVAEALERGVPVLWVATEAPHELRVRMPGETEWQRWDTLQAAETTRL